MKFFKVLGLLIIISGGVIANARDPQVDSLRMVLEKLDEDTLKIQVLNEIAGLLYRTAPDEALVYGTRAKNLAEQISFQKGLADAYKNIGLGNYMQGDYKDAIQDWELALEIYEELGDDQLVANIIGNIGSIYYSSGVSDLAIEYYLRALKIAEKLGDSKRIGTLLLNIGSVYSEQPTVLDTALNYYHRALQIGRSIEYQDLMGLGSINLGQLYLKKEAYDSAFFYLEGAQAFLTSNIDIAASLNDIGKIYAEKGNFKAAIQYHQDALELAVQEQAQLEIARIFLGLASTSMKQGNPRLAIKYYEEAKVISKELGFNYELSSAYAGLAYTHAEISDFQNAYNYLSLQNSIDSTINRVETENKTNYLMFSYQLEKKEDEIAILEAQTEIDKLYSRRQKAISITMGSLGILLLMFAGGIYNRMQFIRKTNKKINTQKNEIESQRDEIEAQRDQLQMQHDMVYSQKELITDSINYAQRIQMVILPSQSQLDELIPQHFIFFKPKDIVSGDFYWIKEVQDHLVIVEADCTGHGVPGAFMSMLGITLLNGLIGDRCFNAPSAILEKLRIKIKEMLLQKGDGEQQKDGMDMVIAIWDKNRNELHFSGANNPIYIIRNKDIVAGKQLEPYASADNDKYRLFEIKGDKQPIGIHWEETAFTSHSVSLHKGDTFYLFSDGFIDQFGGEDRKKFKTLNFKKLLLSVQEESMDRQNRIIKNTFNTWCGEHEQIDDVSIFGIKV